MTKQRGWLHRWITDKCIERRGTDGAMEVVAQEVADALKDFYRNRPPQGTKVHVKISIELPEEPPVATL